MSSSNDEVLIGVILRDNNSFTVKSSKTPPSEPKIRISLANETRTDVSLKKENIINIAFRAQEYLQQSQSQNQLIQLDQLLDKLVDLVKGYTDLPKIRVHLSQDDSSIALSWKMGTATFGASIKLDTSDSSWFLIQGGVRGYHADGYLDDPNFDLQLPSLFSLLMKFRNK